MNKWQIICPLTFLALIGVLAMQNQLVTERHVVTSGVTHQLDTHSANIAALLGTMRTNKPAEIEDAVYAELQLPGWASLITRSDIRVTRTAGGLLQCTIDASRDRVPLRTIHQAVPNYPAPSRTPPR